MLKKVLRCTCLILVIAGYCSTISIPPFGSFLWTRFTSTTITPSSTNTTTTCRLQDLLVIVQYTTIPDQNTKTITKSCICDEQQNNG